MKREDLEKLGLSKEQIDSVCDLNNADVAPLKADLQKAQDDVKAANEKVAAQETTIKELNKDLDAFKDKDADVSGMQKRIEDLQRDMNEKEEQHKKEIADRDFNDVLKEAITAAKGKNAKAIIALLDDRMDALKASKNLKEDIVSALKTLAEAEDSKMLFGEPEATVVEKKNTIGNVGNGGNDKPADSLSSALRERYAKGD